MPVLQFNSTPYEFVSKGLQRKTIHTDNLMTVLVEFTDGPWDEPQPPHSHPHEQITYIAAGKIVFYCEGEEDQHLKPGDMFAVPSGKKHTIKLLTTNARLIDSFTPIREDILR